MKQRQLTDLDPDPADVPLPPPTFRARGTGANPANRFERLFQTACAEWNHADDPAPTTTFLHDDTQSIISENDSPDLDFDASVNPYRGCEHGCIYCYARPYHEYLGFSAGLDFETNILVKANAPELLRQELSKPSWKPRPITLSGVTDCYQPVERRLQLTRRCLQVLAEFRNPVGIITKNHLVTRDADILAMLAGHHAAVVTITITSLRQDLAQVLEPRASVPAARLAAIRTLSQAGIPVGVNVAPVIPGLTEHEIPTILAAAAQAGASYAGYTILRLPHAVAELFTQWLDQHAPTQKAKVLHRIKQLRDGKLNESRFGVRHTGEGVFAEHIADVFRVSLRKARLAARWPEVSTAAFMPPQGLQQTIW